MDQQIRQQLIKVISNFTPKKMMVIGDLMLDQYTWGSVSRISPEAPIPILSVDKEEFRPGGAASVVANIHALNSKVFPVGLIGNDSQGETFLKAMDDLKIDRSGIIKGDSIQTIIKKRVLTSQQQLLRIDYETTSEEYEKFENALMEKIKGLLPQMDGIIFSDYAKGVFSPNLTQQTIQLAKKHQIPICCDPGKGKDYTQYKGVTTIKPNRSETEQASGIKLNTHEQILQAAEVLQNKCACEFLTISLDKDGILLFRNKNDFQFIPTSVKEVFDVTGAGDIVISILGVLIASKISPEIAIHMANVAAQREISHLGVVPIPWREINAYLCDNSLSQKVTTVEQLQHEQWDHNKKPLIFTNGYFDQFSTGHLRFILEIGEIPGKLIVAINSDQSIFRQKGVYPLLKENDRARILASFENVFKVLIFDEDDASNLIEKLKPEIVVKGEKFKGQVLPENDILKQIGTEIKYIPHFSNLP
ncbi:MAG: PfkB family carbohydrate kinase [Deltaproteobacteria bacterium]|nr:PfkB family carbohydrate kinase [Deltaproteobacteria bacterium]